MKCLLAAAGFINADIDHNKNKIMAHLRQYAGRADIVLFGEAFLQGFYGVSFDYEKDRSIALEADCPVICEIAQAARENHIAVSFGFIEKSGDRLYSTQITLDAAGSVIDMYRRVSPGWKEPFADAHYAEGEGFHSFTYLGKRIAVGICGDLWYDANIAAMKETNADVVFWPVYTDFHFEAWNTTEKLAYAKQVSAIAAKVLYVNSVCLDKEGAEIAHGGVAVFSQGKIIDEVPAGSENALLAEV